jgi:hypothetical protein
MTTRTLTVVLFSHERGKVWAQCLEHGSLNTSGKDVLEAKRNILQYISERAPDRPPPEVLGDDISAPKRFYDLCLDAEKSGPILPVYIKQPPGAPRYDLYVRFLLVRPSWELS